MSLVTGPSTGSRLRQHRAKLAGLAALAVTAALVLSTTPSSAATAPTLGTAGSFAVLASTTVTNTGPSVINGDLGVSPGNAVTGFQGGPGTVNGTIHAGDAVAQQARADASTAYTNLAGQACPALNNLTGADLGGRTLTAGVYCFSSSAQLTGALTLNAQGNPDAVFVFKIGSTLTTASNSRVLVTNSDAACNVFWQVGSAATLGTGTDFVGTVITGTEAITATTGATVMGRLVSLNAAVTLDSNRVSSSSCTGAGGTDGGTGGSTTGGTATGGSTTGGTATDGATGGSTTGGTATDGATGGSTTGGTAVGGGTGGSTTGGTANGGGTTNGGAEVPSPGVGTTGQTDTGGGPGGSGTGGTSTDGGGITRGGLPATGASGVLGLVLLGGLAVAVGSALKRVSARAGAGGAP